MKKIELSEALELIKNLPKKCIFNIKVIDSRIIDEGNPRIFKPLFGKFEKVKYCDGENTIKRTIPSFINHWKSSFMNEFWEMGDYKIKRDNKNFVIMPHIVIKLRNLEEFDINQSVKHTMDLIIWNNDKSKEELSEIANSLKLEYEKNI